LKYNKEAGSGWITDFLKRNPSLCSYLPKATTISKATHFNQSNVQHFMEKYESILNKYKLQAHDIYNMDEINVTIAQKTGKIVACQDTHTRSIKCDKGSTLVTMCLAINAAGNFIPPIYIFSKVANNLSLMQGFLKL